MEDKEKIEKKKILRRIAYLEMECSIAANGGGMVS